MGLIPSSLERYTEVVDSRRRAGIRPAGAIREVTVHGST
jgi:hypothetical protein